MRLMEIDRKAMMFYDQSEYVQQLYPQTANEDLLKIKESRLVDKAFETNNSSIENSKIKLTEK